MRRALGLASSFALATTLVLPLAVGAPLANAQTGEPAPKLRVSLHTGTMFGDAWLASTGVTVSADDPTTGTSPDFTWTVTTDADGWFQLYESSVLFEPGWVIIATDGVTTNTHTVRDIAIIGVDPATNIVRGTAVPGTTVDFVGNPIVPGDLYGYSTSVRANDSGEWSITLPPVPAPEGGLLDIIWPGSTVVAVQIDTTGCYDPVFIVDDGISCDGDFTDINWSVPTLDQLLDAMVADGRLPNAGMANGIGVRADKTPLKALVSYLAALVKTRKITQQTMDQILATVRG